MDWRTSAQISGSSAHNSGGSRGSGGKSFTSRSIHPMMSCSGSGERLCSRADFSHRNCPAGRSFREMGSVGGSAAMAAADDHPGVDLWGVWSLTSIRRWTIPQQGQTPFARIIVTLHRSAFNADQSPPRCDTASDANAAHLQVRQHLVDLGSVNLAVLCHLSNGHPRRKCAHGSRISLRHLGHSGAAGSFR